MPSGITCFLGPPHNFLHSGWCIVAGRKLGFGLFLIFRVFACQQFQTGTAIFPLVLLRHCSLTFFNSSCICLTIHSSCVSEEEHACDRPQRESSISCTFTKKDCGFPSLLTTCSGADPTRRVCHPKIHLALDRHLLGNQTSVKHLLENLHLLINSSRNCCGVLYVGHFAKKQIRVKILKNAGLY